MEKRYVVRLTPEERDRLEGLVAVIPARVRRPKDKAKAEVGVQVVERWIMAARPCNAGLQVVRHHNLRYAAIETEGANVRTDPV
ncbi:MAG: hypothetical protein R8K46_08905, partial [Mariprofundaceae bacterium]